MDEDLMRLLEAITVRQAVVLRDLADGYAESEVADRMGISYTGVRSHVARLKSTTGLRNTREIGRWWRNNRDAWLDLVARAGGVER